jgi:hypothetical protein
MLPQKFTIRLLAGIVLAPALGIAPPSSIASAQEQTVLSGCAPVGGELMTNIGAIAGVTNLGPVFGDLAGSVAATIRTEQQRHLQRSTLLGDGRGATPSLNSAGSANLAFIFTVIGPETPLNLLAHLR